MIPEPIRVYIALFLVFPFMNTSPPPPPHPTPPDPRPGLVGKEQNAK